MIKHLSPNGSWLMLTTEDDWEEFSIFDYLGEHKKVSLEYTYGKNSEHTESGSVDLPPGNYSIEGLVSEISEKSLPEDVWLWIAKAMSENKSDPKTTLILKQNI